jgi:predicted kinase
MSKLIMCRGLPASGKSTWAKAQVDASNGNVKRVNRDDLRAMVDNGKWSKSNEKFILSIRDSVILEGLFLGLTVICDDTNLTPFHEKQLRDVAYGIYNSTFEIKDFDTPYEECVRRNALREGPARVPDEAMERMKKDWYKLYGNVVHK